MKQEIAQALDAIQVNINPTGMTILNVVLAFVMFGVALGIKPQTFIDVFKKPKSVILGILCQFFLLPMMTFFLTLLMKDWISPMMGLGMILVASCPGGNISNFMSSLSKANTELSVSLTAISTSVAFFMTPLNFALWGGQYIRHAHITADLPTLEIPFMEIFTTVIILLGIPLVLGILCTRYLPKISDMLRKPLQYLSIIFFIAMVVMAFRQNVDAFLACIKYIFFIVLIHNMLALLIGYCTSAAFRLPYKDKRTLTIETGIQNSGLGLVLLFNPAIFDPAIWANNGGMLIITAWWGVWHIISGLIVSGVFNLTDKIKAKK